MTFGFSSSVLTARLHFEIFYPLCLMLHVTFNNYIYTSVKTCRFVAQYKYNGAWSRQFPHIFSPTAANQQLHAAIGRNVFRGNAHFILFHPSSSHLFRPRIATHGVHKPHFPTEQKSSSPGNVRCVRFLRFRHARRLRLLVSLVRGYRETEAGGLRGG